MTPTDRKALIDRTRRWAENLTTEGFALGDDIGELADALAEADAEIERMLNDALDTQMRMVKAQDAAVLAEREACALIADARGWAGASAELRVIGYQEGVQDCADVITAAIRARKP